MSKAPWFKLWAGDFLSDNYVEAMTAEQVGWYCLLLIRSWNHTPRGYLPNEKQLLRVWCRCASDLLWENEAPLVLERFKTTEDGLFIFHPKLLKQVAKVVETSEKRADAGRIGGIKSGETRRSKREANASKNGSNCRQTQTQTLLGVYTAPPIDSDLQVEGIGHLHPANAHLPAATPLTPEQAEVVIEAIIRDGYELVWTGTKNYREEWDRWPASEKKLRRNFLEFYRKSEYRIPPEQWRRDEQPRNGNGNGSNGARSTSAHTVRTLTNLSAAERAIQRERERAKESETDNRSH